MSAVLSAVAARPHDDSSDDHPWIPEPQGAPATVPHATDPPADRDADVVPERPVTSPVSPPIGDDLSRGACGGRIEEAVNHKLRSELSGYDDESELGDDDTPGKLDNDDDDDLDEFDEIDEDDFDDEFDDDFEEELEDEYEIEIEDEISAEFGLGPDKDDEEEELDDLDSLADDLDEDIDDDLKD